jgi:hypothetical protein
MTRRTFLAGAASPRERLTVPVHRVMDKRARMPPALVENFWRKIWPEAYRNFASGGIDLATSDEQGEVRRTAGDRPVFVGVRRGVLNLVLTDSIPMYWDRARAGTGVTTIWDGHHICMVAMRYAHGNQVPYFSVNTCVHELLHALMQDVFVRQPKWYEPGSREARTDWYATELWLFGDGAAIRESARGYLARLGR